MSGWMNEVKQKRQFNWIIRIWIDWYRIQWCLFMCLFAGSNHCHIRPSCRQMFYHPRGKGKVSIWVLSCFCWATKKCSPDFRITCSQHLHAHARSMTEKLNAYYRVVWKAVFLCFSRNCVLSVRSKSLLLVAKEVKVCRWVSHRRAQQRLFFSPTPPQA